MADGPVIPQGLKDALSKGLVVPFVGAGVSMAVTGHDGKRLFPSWHRLLLMGADRLDAEGKEPEAGLVRNFLKVAKPRYLDAARELHTGLGAVWPVFLKKIFELPSTAAKPSSLDLARAVWELGSPLVITTNYDDVLKWACPPDRLADFDHWDIGAAAEQALWLRNGPPRKPTVWHLHGRIGNTANLILTPGGYERLYCGQAESGYAAALATLRHQMVSKSFLFIGFSLDDEHVGAELSGVLDTFEGYAGPHYVFAQKDKVAALRAKAPSVEVVEYKDHDQLPALLRSLSIHLPTEPKAYGNAVKTKKRRSPNPPRSKTDSNPTATHLAEAYEQRDTLLSDGGDPTEINRRILDLKRDLRRGPQLQTGEFLGDGRYQLYRVIGQGGFATVWLAFDRHEKREVAVKVLHGQFSTSAERRERLFRGAQQMAKLDHPNIVRVLAEPAMDDEDWAYFVMEYLPGGDFRRAVLDETLDLEARLNVLEKIASAVDHAHEKGMIHRDIKPGNILLDAHGEPKLTDFDLVRAEDTTGLTRTKAGMGSYLYAAPESMENAAEASSSCDIYSLAATLIFALQGRELSSRFLIDRENYLSGLGLEVAAIPILKQALNLDPSRRPSSASEFCRGFREKWSSEPPENQEIKNSEPEAPIEGPAVVTQGRKPNDWMQALEQTGNSEERAQVFEEIPDQLADPGACLALVDQLKEGRPGGFDLFWLGWILDQVADRWPGHSKPVEKAQGNLFEHIPEPDPDLFRFVETGLDGRVPLWSEIPAGEGWIGSPDDEQGRYPDEGPRHQIKVEQAFFLSSVAITNRQYAAFDPSKEPKSWDGVSETKLLDHPRVNVDWYEAMAFCRWLSTRAGFGAARLPTEEEWEYACRAGTETRYWNGDTEKDLEAVGWYDDNSGNRAHAVGEKPANPWKLYDMHGNVWEWTASQWKGDYSEQAPGLTVESAATPADLAASPRVGRVFRGGCYWGHARRARSAYRGWSDPGIRGGDLGFRVLLPSAPSEP